MTCESDTPCRPDYILSIITISQNLTVLGRVQITGNENPWLYIQFF